MNNKTANNKTAKNSLPQTTLHVSETADEKPVELQGNKTFATMPKNPIIDIGVNWSAIFCLLLLVAAIGGLIYSVSDAFSVQRSVNKVATVADVIVQLGKNLKANFSGSNLPIRSVVSGQLTFILNGMILLSMLGLLWSLLSRSRKYKNGCRQRLVLENMIITLRGELLALVVGIRATTIELEQATVDTKNLLATLLENHVARSSETTNQMRCLGESAQQMNTLVETMQDVAEQINISSLNASIRAATAGEAGRGFAVIAEEGQRLADLSDGVANEINERLKNMQQDANGAISFVESTTMEATHDIEFMRQDCPPLVNQADEAAEPIDEKTTDQQSTVSDTKMSEIAQSLGQMKTIAQQLKHAIAKFDMLTD